MPTLKKNGNGKKSWKDIFRRKKREPDQIPPGGEGGGGDGGVPPGQIDPNFGRYNGRLNPKLVKGESDKMSHFMGSSFQLLVERAGGFGDVPEPDYETLEKMTLNKEGGVGSKVLKYGEKAGDKTSEGGEMANGGMDVAEAVDKFKAIKAGTYKPEGGAGGADIAGTVLSAFGNLMQIYHLGKDIINAIANRDNSKETIFGIIGDTLKTMVGIGQTIVGGLKMVSSLASKMPLVGAIFGAVSSALSFISDLKSLIKSSVQLDKMRVQHKLSKSAVWEHQRPNDPMHEYVSAPTAGLHMSHSYGQVDYINKHGKARSRAKRLDEVTSDGTLADNPELRNALEEYDITGELAGATGKRTKDAVFNIVVNDFVGFASSLATLDPSGIGSVVGATLSLASTLVGASRAAGRKLQQKGRDWGLGGFDKNKSSRNKKIRRHRLAIGVFNRVKGLNTYGINALKVRPTLTDTEVDNVRAAMTAYKPVKNMVTAMQVGYGPLMDAADSNEMVGVMRQGFYRDNS